MSAFNSFIYAGRIIRLEPIKTVLKVTIETTNTYKEETTTIRASVTYFGKKADALKERLQVGQAVIASGSIKSREHEGRDYMDLSGTECVIVQSKVAQPAPPPPPPPEDDEIPF